MIHICIDCRLSTSLIQKTLHAQDEDEEEEIVAEEGAAVASELAEEEERRWRQGLLSLDVEVKDLAVTIDSKEKLLDQLCEAQKEHERLREIYEQTLRDCDAEVSMV